MIAETRSVIFYTLKDLDREELSAIYTGLHLTRDSTEQIGANARQAASRVIDEIKKVL